MFGNPDVWVLGNLLYHADGAHQLGEGDTPTDIYALVVFENSKKKHETAEGIRQSLEEYVEELFDGQEAVPPVLLMDQKSLAETGGYNALILNYLPRELKEELARRRVKRGLFSVRDELTFQGDGTASMRMGLDAMRPYNGAGHWY